MMRNYLIRRLLLLIPVVLGVATFVFLIIHLIPGDPIDLMLGETARQTDRAALTKRLGLDRPLAVQYIDFMGGIVRGDLGRSLRSGEKVSKIILRRLPASIQLGGAALILAIIIALPAGVISATRKNSAWDHGSMFMALLGVSMPNFWLGPLLIIIFSLYLGLLPVSGTGGGLHLILPAVTLGTALAAILTRMTRSSLLETLDQEYVNTARAKGLGERMVVWKHALVNALIPLITVLGLQVGALLSGSIITETIFAWPGIGRLTIEAIWMRDYPVVQGTVLVIAMGYVLVNLAVDILYAAVDPRIKFQ